MTARAVFFSRRRGACPGLSVPLPTGDGLLVRFMPVGTIPLAAFAHLCSAARDHGNGIVEVTSRGSVQVRGLSIASAPRFADAIAALEIAAADGISILSNPLAGLDPQELLDAGAFASVLRRTLAHEQPGARLAPKVSIAVDGGGALGLDQIAADIRLLAAPMNSDVMLRVGIGGTAASATQLGFVARRDGVEAATRLLHVIARRGRDARARDVLAAEGISAFLSAVSDLLIADVPPPSTRPSREAIGLHRLRDGSLACGLGLAFGHADATVLEKLADEAATAGANGLRASPGRVLMIVGLTEDAASAFMADAGRLGFIVCADDPRRHVVACAGAPVCASAHIAARAIAPIVAAIASSDPDGRAKIHISGCAKGCAHSGIAGLTVVGGPSGCALIANGTVRDAPFATVATDELPAAIAHHFREARREADHA
jgi:precorrin-3B synthase